MARLKAVIEAVAASLADSDVVYGHGTDNAWDEAVALVLGVTGYSDDSANLGFEVDSDHEKKIHSLLHRRISERIPMAYLLGECAFAGHRFHIETGVVIPRSPIAELISVRFKPWLSQAPETIVDLCCGSGCIGIAAALEFPDSHLTLVDLDPKAVAVAGRNAARHGLVERTNIVQSDLFDSVIAGRFDLIVSNPPYVAAQDMVSLPEEYAHEPELGLAGGPDGLDLLRRILDVLPERQSEGGLFVGEVGMSAAALLAAFPDLPFIWPDLISGGAGVFILPAGWDILRD